MHDWQPWEYPQKWCTKCHLLSEYSTSECSGKVFPIGLMDQLFRNEIDFRNGKWVRKVLVELSEDELPEGYYEEA